jgi:hypothetical protein
LCELLKRGHRHGQMQYLLSMLVVAGEISK